jgi:hypothetical protein
MDLGAYMMGNEPHDALAVGCSKALARIRQAAEIRSTQSRPSGLSITSTMMGSSSQAAIDGPSAVRNMRAPRDTTSDWKE